MPLAYVALNVHLGSEGKLQKILQEMEGVEEVYLCHGVYDLLVKVQTEETADLTNLITKEIRRLPDIEMTMTMLVAGEIERDTIWQMKQSTSSRSLTEQDSDKQQLEMSQYRSSARIIAPK
ncbi:MAG: Lrp/AsnC ligand binding domain-containing protein [Candidatus Hodarchaeota archaeon]